MVKKSITVTDQQDKWLQSQMATGNYGTDSEIIREALREKQMRMAEVEAIRAKLIAAEQSGFTEKNAQEMLAEFKEKALEDGKL
ncbi:type II toxin-antitoxin system ParD family antitoxin [Alteromonas sp. a30]|nr:type II toxin-antitoxin system ParD family antitoxin [Alteromonas sp. a30]